MGTETLDSPHPWSASSPPIRTPLATAARQRQQPLHPEEEPLCTAPTFRLLTRTNRASRRRPQTLAAGALAVPSLAQFMLILDLSWVNVALPSLSADHD